MSMQNQNENNHDSQNIWVNYSLVDGAHFFTGVDGYAQGLCVAHKDFKTAFDEVAVQLTNLLLINHGENAVVTPAVSYEDFAKV